MISSTKTIEEPVLAGFGNALLDLSIVIKDKFLIEKYNFPHDGQQEISSEVLESLLKDVQSIYKNSIHYGAGGSVQNTCRVLQWIVGIFGYTIFFGGIGNDETGKMLAKILKEAGVKTEYAISDTKLTGTCVGLVDDDKRSLVAHVGASHLFTIDNLKRKSTNGLALDNVLQKVRIILLEAFFIPERYEVVKYLINFTKTHSNLFVFNLNATYLFTNYAEEIKFCALQCDILFGNVHEYQQLVNYLDLSTEDSEQDSSCTNSNENIALYLNRIYTSRTNTELKRKIIIITDGGNPVICVSGDQHLDIVPVPPVQSIKDTTGAGDAFVAGFLAGFLQNLDILTCINWGILIAQKIIQEIGCTIPNMNAREILEEKTLAVN